MKFTKKLLAAAIAVGSLSSAVNVTVLADSGLASYDAVEGTEVFQYTSGAVTIDSTNPVTAPTYLIYPDGPVTSAEAENLIESLGVKANADQYNGKIYVINPVDGKAYGEADYELFKAEQTKDGDGKPVSTSILDLCGSMLNTKVIGLGEGATFVNEYVSQADWGIAGIMVYGGEAGETPKYSVPAYVSGTLEEAEPYITAIDGEAMASDTVAYYQNSDCSHEKVVVNSTGETEAEAFANAWSYVFSKTTRIGNFGGTFYSMANSKERDWEYASFVVAEDYGFTRNVVVQDLDGDGVDSLWYEYIPKTVKDAEDGTVPMVVLLHGNTNDPRTQFETSGWAAVARDNGIILVCPEYQGATIGGYAYDPMDESESTEADSAIITMIEEIEKKYPQIDTSKIYVEGLSKGSLNATNIALSNPDVFAAAGAHSGGEFEQYYDTMMETVNSLKDEYDMPIYIVGGTKDVLFPMIEKGETAGALLSVQLYETLNEMEVTEFEDLSYDNTPYIGIALENAGYIENTGSAKIYGGTLTNEKGVQISINAIEDWGHWNYEPTAQLMWDFFRNYSRETEETETTDVFRLYNPNSGEHFYTVDTNEKDTLVDLGWNYEGTAWVSPAKSDTPVLRLYNANGGEHHYTIDEEEKNVLVSLGWKDEGIAFYAAEEGAVTVYREYNPNQFANNHNFTTNKEEHDYLISIGWNDESPAWTVLEAGTPVEEEKKEETPSNPWLDLIPEGSAVSTTDISAWEKDAELFDEYTYETGNETIGTLTYYVYDPTKHGYDKGGNYPVALWFHGGGNGSLGRTAIIAAGAAGMAEEDNQADIGGMYIICPLAAEGTRFSWTEEHPEYVREILNKVIADNSITGKTFLAGTSNGGLMVDYYLEDYSDEVDGVFWMSTTIPDAETVKAYSNKGIHMWFEVGYHDETGAFEHSFPNGDTTPFDNIENFEYTVFEWIRNGDGSIASLFAGIEMGQHCSCVQANRNFIMDDGTPDDPNHADGLSGWFRDTLKALRSE